MVQAEHVPGAADAAAGHREDTAYPPRGNVDRSQMGRSQAGDPEGAYSVKQQPVWHPADGNCTDLTVCAHHHDRAVRRERRERRHNNRALATECDAHRPPTDWNHREQPPAPSEHLNGVAESARSRYASAGAHSDWEVPLIRETDTEEAVWVSGRAWPSPLR